VSVWLSSVVDCEVPFTATSPRESFALKITKRKSPSVPYFPANKHPPDIDKHPPDIYFNSLKGACAFKLLKFENCFKILYEILLCYMSENCVANYAQLESLYFFYFDESLLYHRNSPSILSCYFSVFLWGRGGACTRIFIGASTPKIP
jgi:hypothetical protein